MRYWSLKELSIIFNTKPQRLNYYCNSCGIAPMLGRRPKVFNQEAVDKLSRIISYVREGYNLKAIKNKL